MRNSNLKFQFSYLYILICSFLLQLGAGINLINAQETFDDYTGVWSDNLSWTSGNSPGTSINNTDVTVFGEIYANECLDFNLSKLTISDTLVINGNLELKNAVSLTVNSNAVLIVLGDYESKNKVDVINNGTILFAGSFKMVGADSKGSFINNDKVFIFDPNPKIKSGTGYTTLSCKVVSGDTICGYMDKEDYPLDALVNYTNNLPYDLSSVSTIKNTCTKLEISIDKLEVCQNEALSASANAVGIKFPDSLIWNFGVNAAPTEAVGFGPHEVRYSNSGTQQIELSYSPMDSVTRQILLVNDSAHSSCSSFSLDIDLDKTEVCENEIVTVNCIAKGINYTDSILWNFGTQSIPKSAIGIGPHQIKYTTTGVKHIELSYAPLSNNIKQDVLVNEPAQFIHEIIGSNFDDMEPQYTDRVCQGNFSTLEVERTEKDDLFHWVIPAISIDSITLNSLRVEWSVVSGEYSVYVNGISSKGCSGDPIDGLVIIDKCEVENVYSKRTYAFTPNEDGYNDYWVIDGIEEYPLAKIRVYDKSGKVVFKNDGSYMNNWDGTENGRVLPLDSYFYIVDLSVYNKELVRGLVTILHE